MSNESDYWTKTKAEMLKEKDLSIFKTWNTVRSIPIYKDNEFPITYPPEVKCMILHRPHEEILLWKKCLKEPFLGHTNKSYADARFKFLDDVVSTTWTLKSAHHVLTYEALSGRSIKSYDQIVEFGAGIGETARLILDLGFRGNYYILDLPETGRISEYYLQGRANICKSLSEIPQRENTLFIATWSLSEVPVDYRNDVVQYFRNSDFLIIFQKEIFGYDNYAYFTRQFPLISNTEIKLRQIVWHAGAKGNWYLAASATKPDKFTSTLKQVNTSYVLPPMRHYRIRIAAHFLTRIPGAIWRRRHRLLNSRPG